MMFEVEDLIMYFVEVVCIEVVFYMLMWMVDDMLCYFICWIDRIFIGEKIVMEDMC